MSAQLRNKVLFRFIGAGSIVVMLAALFDTQLAFGRLPGDILIGRADFPLDPPIASTAAISIAVAAIFFVVSHLLSRR